MTVVLPVLVANGRWEFPFVVWDVEERYWTDIEGH